MSTSRIWWEKDAVGHCWLWRWRREVMQQGKCIISRSWKSQKNRLDSLKASGRNATMQNFDFSPEYPVWTLNRHDRSIILTCSFQTIKLSEICCNSNRELWHQVNQNAFRLWTLHFCQLIQNCLVDQHEAKSVEV